MRPGEIEVLDLTLLHLEAAEVHGAAVDARRRAGLESPADDAELLELLREMRRRRVAGAPAGDLRLGADVNAPAQERAGGDHDRARAEAPLLERLDAEDRARLLVDEQPRDGALHREDVGVLLEERPHRAPVESAIALRARRPHGGPLAAIEHPELERREVRRASHDAAERVDLARDGALRDPADRRIAGHLADRLERRGEEDHPRAEPRRGDRGLDARMTAADDDDIRVELGAE